MEPRKETEVFRPIDVQRHIEVYEKGVIPFERHWSEDKEEERHVEHFEHMGVRAGLHYCEREGMLRTDELERLHRADKRVAHRYNQGDWRNHYGEDGQDWFDRFIDWGVDNAIFTPKK